jgi:hypothetical protein
MSGSTFIAHPECDSTTFTPVVNGAGSAITISNSDNSSEPSRSVQEYKDLTYTHNTGKGLIQNSYIPIHYNIETKTWNSAEGYIQSIKNGATSNDTAHYLLANNEENTTSATNIPSQIQKDDEYFRRIKLEYCFLRKYYHGFLNAFLQAVQDNNANASVYLDILIQLNAKINAFVSLVDHIASQRAKILDARTAEFVKQNDILQNTIIQGPSVADSHFLDKQKSILDTRKEMVRYTKEKNNSITNNISLWAALNVVAIAMIFTLYRKM